MPDNDTGGLNAAGRKNPEPANPHKITAVHFVAGYHGFGVNTFYSLIKNFPGWIPFASMKEKRVISPDQSVRFTR
jgi:hypothetical protein